MRNFHFVVDKYLKIRWCLEYLEQIWFIWSFHFSHCVDSIRMRSCESMTTVCFCPNIAKVCGKWPKRPMPNRPHGRHVLFPLYWYWKNIFSKSKFSNVGHQMYNYKTSAMQFNVIYTLFSKPISNHTRDQNNSWSTVAWIKW